MGPPPHAVWSRQYLIPNARELVKRGADGAGDIGRHDKVNSKGEAEVVGTLASDGSWSEQRLAAEHRGILEVWPAASRERRLGWPVVGAAGAGWG
jgi:hypothetical protein